MIVYLRPWGDNFIMMAYVVGALHQAFIGAPLFFFRGVAPPGPSARADGRAGDPFPHVFFCIVFFLGMFVWGIRALGGISSFFS